MTPNPDAARRRPQSASTRRPARALPADQPHGRVTGRASTLRPLESLPALQPDEPAVLHAQFDVDVRLVDWQESRLSANDRPHIHEKAKRTKIFRLLGAAAARRAGIEPLDWARVVIYVRAPTNVRQEVSNLQPTAKAIVDGLVDAGLLPDDRDELAVGPDMRRLWPNGARRVVVQLWRRP